MTSPRYEAPSSLDAAVELLATSGDAASLAGGTDLIVAMSSGRRTPGLVVDLKRIPELGELRLDGEDLVLGAAVPCARIREYGAVRERFPGLAEAIGLIGSEQIQGRATVGGNLCNGSPAADTAPALIVLGARCTIAGPSGVREVPVESFPTGPGETVLGPAEILVSIRIPGCPSGSADAYLRFIPRTEMDIAVVGAAAWLHLGSDGRCVDARVALGAVAPTPIRVPGAEVALRGSDLGAAALDAAAEAARAAARPIDDLRGPAWYRRHVAGVLVRRAIETAHDRARGRSR